MSETTLYRTFLNDTKDAARLTRVASFSGRTKDDESVVYIVRDAFTPWAICTCPDHQSRRRESIGDDRVCKHIAFVREVLEQAACFNLAVHQRLELARKDAEARGLVRQAERARERAAARNGTKALTPA